MEAKEKVILFDNIDNILGDLSLSDDDIIRLLPTIRNRLLECRRILNDNITTEEYDEHGEG